MFLTPVTIVSSGGVEDKTRLERDVDIWLTVRSSGTSNKHPNSQTSVSPARWSKISHKYLVCSELILTFRLFLAHLYHGNLKLTTTQILPTQDRSRVRFVRDSSYFTSTFGFIFNTNSSTGVKDICTSFTKWILFLKFKLIEFVLLLLINRWKDILLPALALQL